MALSDQRREVSFFDRQIAGQATHPSLLDSFDITVILYFLIYTYPLISILNTYMKITNIDIDLTSSSRASRGRKFQKKKELYSKETICL